MKNTISILVENKPGVLARIAAMFSARDYNIDSLSVAETMIQRSQGSPVRPWEMILRSNRS